MGLLDILNQALAASGNQQPSAQQFDQVAQAAPADVLGRGIGAALASKDTPPIGDMVSSLFGQSNGQQQAGALNAIIAALGPAVAAGLAGGALGKLLRPGQTQITADEAARISPTEVRDVVNAANDQQPGIADQLGRFYAEHRGLVNTLGGLAASIALMKMKDHLANRE